MTAEERERRVTVAVTGLPVPGGIAGGAGDLQQLACPLDVAAAALLLRLDERVDVHRVSFAKKAVARFRQGEAHRSRLRGNASRNCTGRLRGNVRSCGRHDRA